VVEAFSSELQGFVCANVPNIVGRGAALLVALLIEAQSCVAEASSYAHTRLL
jgi:hypothetical protein